MNTMTRAHEIKREAAKKWNCQESEIVFGICLKMAHAEVNMNASTMVVEWTAGNGSEIRFEIKTTKSHYDVNSRFVSGSTEISAFIDGVEEGHLVGITHDTLKGRFGRIGLTEENWNKISGYKRSKKSKSNHTAGWCNKCQSYCWGDYTAN